MAVAPARVATPAPARPRPAPRAHDQRRVAGGVVWIVVAAILLSGLVALNVAVLQLNVELDGLSRERSVLQGERAALEAQLASAAAAPRIQARARKELGLVPADQSQTRYLDLSRPR